MTADIESVIRDLDARRQIRDAVLRWARGVDRNDPDLIRSAFHSDGWDDHGAFAGTADDFAMWVVDLHLTNYVWTTHYMLNHYVEVNGSTAKGETCALALLRFEHDGTPYDMVGRGRYLDDYEERDGEWRIVRRSLVLDTARIADATDLAPALFGPDGAALVAKMRHAARDRTDPSYVHFGTQTASAPAGRHATPVSEKDQ
jgi:hypothetical protein